MYSTYILHRTLVLGYLVLLLLGSAYAVLRFQPVPFRPVTFFMYGMLAPYQGYSETSEAFLAEGLSQGEWTTIDLAPYFPVLPGERSMRERRLYINLAGFSSENEAQRHVALLLRDLEARAGRSYEQVRLTWVQWRPQPEGLWNGFDAPTQTRFLVTAP